MLMIQTELTAGKDQLVCWLATDPRVKVGTRLSLKGDPETVYTVTAQYKGTIRELANLEVDWKPTQAPASSRGKAKVS